MVSRRFLRSIGRRNTAIRIRTWVSYSKIEDMKEKRYKKSVLRKALERNMKTTISPKEFARWFCIYCEMNGKSAETRNAKELSEVEVEELAEWLGYKLW